MGYKCDVCCSADATVFCFADEAMMCAECDTRVHDANKLATMPERVSLQKETESATCDICQEHKAVMFCSEDRALICRRCDLMIHTANEFVAKHHRYLLSGVSVGLKALDGSSGEEADEGQARKPYGLRRTPAASTKDRDSWRNAVEPTSWAGASASTEQPTVLSHGAGSGSQPSLINLGNPATATPPLEPLTATPFVTQFGGRGALHSSSRSSTQDTRFKYKGGRDLEHNVPLGKQLTNSSPSTSPPPAGEDPGCSGDAYGWGADELSGEVYPNSSDFTLAAELLGLPSVSQGFTAKDIDAAYIFDDNCNLDADLSALLEVPDLGAFQNEIPMFVGSQQDNRLSCSEGGKPVGEKRGSPSDGVVPDLGSSLKRQRI